MTTIRSVTPRPAALLLFITAVALVRVFNAAVPTALGNFSPLGAMALFSGACFAKRPMALLFSLTALLLSDMAIGALVFQGRYGILYSGWYWIYGIFALLVLLGGAIIRRITAGRVLLASVSAALLHWLLADWSVWLGGGLDLRTMQPLARNWEGLLQCYAQGFPFFKNFLLGTLAYSSLLFGIYAWLRVQKPYWITVRNMSV
jgi:hypothetical protein